MAVPVGVLVPAAPSEPGYRALTVGRIQGGGSAAPALLSKVGDLNFKIALESSLRRLGYLADSNGRYVVDATIEDVDQPGGSLDPVLIVAPVDWSVTVKIRYVVMPVDQSRPVFDELVAATGQTGDRGLVASERVRSATEAAVQANLEAFLDRLKREWKAGN